MESEPPFRQFLERRERFLESWNNLMQQAEEVLERLKVEGPTITDAAVLEGLRAERRRLFEDYEKAADQFVDYVVSRSRTSEKPAHEM